jgi:TonB family protein
VLAPNDDSDAQDPLGFSFAGDIVELVIFTTDDAFLQTLRDAVGDSRRLWHVPSADKVSDLLLAGQVGILVLDTQALAESANEFVTQIKRQFPDLVLVVAGDRHAETSLANLISAGVVYRFIHKPMSPGRAKLFADAAVRKYGEQRRRVLPPPLAPRSTTGNQRLLIGAAAAAAAVVLVAVWALHRGSPLSTPSAATADRPAATESPLLARAAAALAANRLTSPDGDGALELYLDARARNPLDPAAAAGLAEVHERLWARAENALLEERLDEAAAAIEIARKAGVDSGRIALLMTQLAKSRARLKGSMAQNRTHDEAQPPTAGAVADPLTEFLSLAEARVKEGRLIAPEGDNAHLYVERALAIDPSSNAVQAAKQTLAANLLVGARSSIDRHDFTQASNLLDAANGIAAPSNVENARQLLNAARKQAADTDAWDQLLKSGLDRLRQDRLVEPPTDSAKFYLLALRTADPGHSGLTTALQELAQRLVVNARLAVELKQYDAARNWLSDASAVGLSPAESSAVAKDIDDAVNQQQLLASVLPANQLTSVKIVPPVYPPKAERAATEGWVELDFTVTDNGRVQDIAVHAANPENIFDAAAIAALTQWRYQPVLKEGKPIAQRARIRIRFSLAADPSRPAKPR